jgi:hypothetical protein
MPRSVRKESFPSQPPPNFSGADSLCLEGFKSDGAMNGYTRLRACSDPARHYVDVPVGDVLWAVDDVSTPVWSGLHRMLIVDINSKIAFGGASSPPPPPPNPRTSRLVLSSLVRNAMAVRPAVSAAVASPYSSVSVGDSDIASAQARLASSVTVASDGSILSVSTNELGETVGLAGTSKKGIAYHAWVEQSRAKMPSYTPSIEVDAVFSRVLFSRNGDDPLAIVIAVAPEAVKARVGVFKDARELSLEFWSNGSVVRTTRTLRYFGATYSEQIAEQSVFALTNALIIPLETVFQDCADRVDYFREVIDQLVTQTDLDKWEAAGLFAPLQVLTAGLQYYGLDGKDWGAILGSGVGNFIAGAATQGMKGAGGGTRVLAGLIWGGATIGGALSGILLWQLLDELRRKNIEKAPNQPGRITYE